MRGMNGRALARVGLFTAVCLVFMFILVTVFGQFRFDATTTYNAVFTNVSGLKGGNFVRIAGVEVGKVKNMTLHKDGTVTVEFADRQEPDADRGHQGGGALREPDRRPLSGPGRRTGLGAQTATGTDHPARTDRRLPSTSTRWSAVSGRCFGRWIPTRSTRCPANC